MQRGNSQVQIQQDRPIMSSDTVFFNAKAVQCRRSEIDYLNSSTDPGGTFSKFSQQIPLIAQLAERETVVLTDISRSPVRIRLRGSLFCLKLNDRPNLVICSAPISPCAK